jgi:predicted nucleic acid-binding protein
MSGITERVHHSPIYIDANPFIYAVDGDDALATLINAFFTGLRAWPGVAVTSEMTLAEVLPRAPLPRHRRAYFNLILWSGIFDLRPVTRGILIETADYRRAATSQRPDGSDVMPKLPDAIHVVTAIRADCETFLSADAGIRLPVEMWLVAADPEGIARLTEEFS